MTLDCRYCETRHDDRWLCDPARKVLDALLERGQRFDMPELYGDMAGDSMHS